jgi:hypothetical protein
MFDMIDQVRHRTQALQEAARRIREERDLRAYAATSFEAAPVADDPQPVRAAVVPCPECPSGTPSRSQAA